MLSVTIYIKNKGGVSKYSEVCQQQTLSVCSTAESIYIPAVYNYALARILYSSHMCVCGQDLTGMCLALKGLLHRRSKVNFEFTFTPGCRRRWVAMASRAGPRATGTDGSDYQHRERVAAHYQMRY